MRRFPTRLLLQAAVCLVFCVATAPAQYGLPTTFAGGNGQGGNMFDVTATRDIVITGFDLNINFAIGTIEVWAVTAGTSFIGSQSTPADWTLIDSVAVSSSGPGQETSISLSDGIHVGVGQTLGLYVTSTGGGNMIYTTGSNFDGVAAQDASLTVHEGVGKSYPFSATFGGLTPGGASRIWNGRIRYEVASQLTTTFTGGVGQAGNMFDVVSTRLIVLQELDVHLDPGTFDLEVYATNSGSFVGKEVDPLQWTLIGSTSVTSAGSNTASSVPLLFNFEFSGTRGFYVTVAMAGFDMNYSTGSNFGGAVVDDGVVSVREGVGSAYPFAGAIGGPTPGGPSRIWNGRLRYSLAPVSFVNEDFDSVPGGGSSSPPVGWLQDLNDVPGAPFASDWFFRDNGPSSGNGPFMDHTTGTGNFAYTEDSSPSEHAAINLLTPLVEKGGNDRVSFWVNSNVSAFQNPLAVDVIEYPRGIVHRDIVLPIGETAGNWTEFTACLTPFDGPLLQLRFRGRTDSGSFSNDVGLDDVEIASGFGPAGTGQAPQSGLATLDINDAGDSFACRPVASGVPGPYRANAHGEGSMDIVIGSEPSVPVLFFAGPINPNVLDLGAIGKLDVGNPGLTGIVLIADGNGTGFLDSLFRTNASGNLLVSLPTPAPLLGFSLGFQVITFNSSPSAISLSNAVDVTFIP